MSIHEAFQSFVAAVSAFIIAQASAPAAPFLTETGRINNILFEEVSAAGLSIVDYRKLVAVARCESRMRHTDDHGSLLRGPTGDGGAFQITDIHKEEARKKGLNIFLPEGNVKYAVELYKKQGLKPWKSSAKCQNKKHD